MGWQGGAPRGAAMRRAGGMTDVQRKYEHGLKYDADEKYERNGSDQVAANNGSSYRNMNREGYSNSSDGSQTPQAAIASLDKRISTVQHDLNQALQDVTSKENEKFDLIFSILVELQKRQAQLEESVRTVKAQLSSASGASMEQQPEAVSSPQQGQQQGQQRGQQHTPQQAQQVAGQMGPPMGGYMAGQMPMNQQYVASDGSPTYWAPVVVAMPQNGAQMPYAVPQMMPASPMQPMPQQMTMQFVGQGQAGEEYQWAGTAAESTARSSGSQTAEGAPQEAQPPSSEECKVEPQRAEEE
mmetsp:Transcript_80714/g.187383  ORF Transcript_80714/g.187383 Transcript_80714/m.187383 type:complete len:298 (+) Transcript_80714:50-943(+)